MIENVSARVLELAEEFGLDLTGVSGTGNGGRILKADITPQINSIVRGENRERYEENNENQAEYERRFCQYYNWEYIEYQQPGDAVDCIDQEGTKRELKFDWSSILDTNQSAYIELQQGVGIEQSASGYLLAKEQADRFVIINDHTVWEFTIEDMDRMILENFLLTTEDSRPTIRIVSSGMGVGGNQGSFGTKGISIPFQIVDRYCTEKRANPLARDYPWWIPFGDRWRRLIDIDRIDTSNCTCCNEDSRAYDD